MRAREEYTKEDREMKTCPKCENETSDELFNKLRECYFCGNPDFSGITKTDLRFKLELVCIVTTAFITILAAQSMMAFLQSTEEGIASLGPLFLAKLIYYYFRRELKLRDSTLKGTEK